MGIKIKNRDPKTTDFASTDLVINRKEGTLFFKSDSSLVKLEPLISVNVPGISPDGITGFQIGTSFIIATAPTSTGGGSGEWDGSAVTLTGKLTGGSQEIEGSNFDIDGGNIDGTTIATSDITVGSGKTLDVSAGTLTLANNQISGDKVEGGTINAITINQLLGALNVANHNLINVDINSGTIDGTDINVSGDTLTTSTAQKLAIVTGAGHTEVLTFVNAYHTNYNESSGTWVGPTRNSVDGRSWSQNYGDDSGVLTLPSVDFVTSGIIVPFACTLLGFQVLVVAATEGTVATTQFALYKGDFDYADGSSGASSINITSGTATNMTIEQVSTATTGTPGAIGNPMFVSVTNGSTALAIGDILYPRLKHNDDNNSDIYFRMNILIKR